MTQHIPLFFGYKRQQWQEQAPAELERYSTCLSSRAPSMRHVPPSLKLGAHFKPCRWSIGNGQNVIRILLKQSSTHFCFLQKKHGSHTPRRRMCPKMPCTSASSQAFGRQEGHYRTGCLFSKCEALDAGVCRQTLLAWSSNTFWRRDIIISEFLQQYSVLSILKPPVVYESGAGWRFLLLYLKYNAKTSMPSISACIWTWRTM